MSIDPSFKHEIYCINVLKIIANIAKILLATACQIHKSLVYFHQLSNEPTVNPINVPDCAFFFFF